MSDSSNNPTPSAKGGDGRDARGRFAPGWRGGPGNPLAKQTAALRSALLNAVKPGDVREVVRKLVAAAKAGDVTAARELLNRIFGTPAPADLLERVEQLEQLIETQLREQTV